MLFGRLCDSVYAAVDAHETEYATSLFRASSWLCFCDQHKQLRSLTKLPPTPTPTDRHSTQSMSPTPSSSPPPSSFAPRRPSGSSPQATAAAAAADTLTSRFDMDTATAQHSPSFFQYQHQHQHNDGSIFNYPAMAAPQLIRENSNSGSGSRSASKPLLLPRLLPRIHTPDESGAIPSKLRPLPALVGSPTEPSMTAPPSAPALEQTGGSAQTLVSLLQSAQTASVPRKRSFSSGEDENEDDEDDIYSSHTVVWTPRGTQEHQQHAHARKKTRSRKPTYLVRKEEKDLLIEQVSKLEAQVAFLRERSGVADWQTKDQRLQQKEVANNMLRETVRNQQFAFFSAQSVVSELLTSSHRCPIDTYIHLGKDWNKRRETLVALKAQKLHDAQRLLEKRTQFMDPTRELSEDTNFVAENGDYCAIGFQSTPLLGAKCGVRQVYDALHFHTQNMEHSIAEAMGTVLTSDGDDNWDKTILHRRLVHSNVRDVLTESNFVVFSEFYDDRKKDQWSLTSESGGAAGKELGVIVLDFVDEDELYPYRSRQCVRQDVTGVITLRAVPSKPPATSVSAPGSAPKQEQTVVITRWLMLKLRHNAAMAIPEPKMQELKARINEIGNALIRTVQDSTMGLASSRSAAAGVSNSNSSRTGVAAPSDPAAVV